MHEGGRTGLLRYPYQPGSKPPKGAKLPFTSGSMIDLESAEYSTECNVGTKDEAVPYDLRWVGAGEAE